MSQESTTKSSLRNKRLAIRVLDAVREFGILLLVFAPLDAVFTGRDVLWAPSAGVLFAIVGFCALTTALVVEWRWIDVE